MRTGMLRHVVTVRYQSTETTDSYGGTTPVWSDFATGVRAALTPLSGREIIRSGAAQSEARMRIKMRYLPGLTPTMRIVESGTTYEIVEPPIDVGGRGKWHEVLCKTVSGA